jgi:predicted  nucleic acid-binding Zn-ribbon protein
MTLVRRGEPASEAREIQEEGESPGAQDSSMADNTTVDLSTLGGEGFGDGSTEQQNGETSVVESASTPDMSVETPEKTVEATANGSDNRKPSISSTSSSIKRGGARSTSSKFASLRANFEQPNSPESAGDSTKRKLSNIEHVTDRAGERKQELEGELTRLKDELEKEREMRIAYEEKVTQLEEEVDELQSQLEEQEHEHEQQTLQLKSEAESRINALASEARNRTHDTNNLQKQLVDLKRDVSASTRSSPQTSDATFRQEVEILQHEVQNWVVNNYRRVKLDAIPDALCKKIESVAESKQYERLKPIYEKFDVRAKLPIFQATVACFMMEVFEEPFLFGLQGQRDWGKRLKQAAEGLSSVFDAATYNRWRASTFNTLRQAEGIREPVESSATALAEMICITLKAITDVEDSDARLSSLKTIVLRAISTAHLIRVQQSQYLFSLPAPDEPFDSVSMDDINEVVDGDSRIPIRCATFPAIFKLSDGDGDMLEERNVVVKAKVLCNDDET